MPRRKLPAIIFKYRGPIERGSPYHGYKWMAGYSPDSPEGYIQYPWNTFRECQREAAMQGKRAVFIKNGDPRLAKDNKED